MKKQNELPKFIQKQMEFTAYIRSPNESPVPEDIDPERIKVYRRLVFNNINSFLQYNFPVLYSISEKEQWHAILNDFLAKHKSQAPLFTEIPQEFLNYLEAERDDSKDPEYLYELAHYEWARAKLAILDITIDFSEINPQANLMLNVPEPSSLAWLLQYNYPVHEINKDWQPEAIAAEPVYLVIYRNAENEVKTLNVNQATALLINLIFSKQNLTGEQLTQQIAAQLQQQNLQKLFEWMKQTLNQLLELGIILGGKAAQSSE